MSRSVLSVLDAKLEQIPDKSETLNLVSSQIGCGHQLSAMAIACSIRNSLGCLALGCHTGSW